MKGLEQDTALIRALVEFAGETPAAVAKRANVAVTTVNRPHKGNAPSRLGRAVIDKLREAFPDFPGWSDYLGQSLAMTDPDLVAISEIDLRYGLGATYVDRPVEAQKRVFSRSWLLHFTRSSPDHLFWTAGDGDSMEPTIRSGEILLIDTAQKIVRMSGGIWAVTMGEMGMIKRLHVPGRNQLQLLSDNGREPPIIPIEDDELQIIGRVVAVVRRL